MAYSCCQKLWHAALDHFYEHECRLANGVEEVGLEAQAETGLSKEWKCLLQYRSAAGGWDKNPSHYMKNEFKHLCPQVSNPGVHLLKLEGFKLP